MIALLTCVVRAWKPASLFLLVVPFTGCSTTGLSSRESGPGSYSQMVCEMARTQPINETPHRLRTPIRLGVAQIGEVSPSTNLLMELRRHPELITEVIALPAPGDADRFNPRAPNAAAFAGQRLADLRSLARTMGAEQLLLLGGSIDTWSSRNALAPLDITLVGTALFPSVRLNGQGKAAGVLLDVDSGAARFQVQAERHRRTAAPSAFADNQCDSLRVALRDELSLGLAQEFVTRLRAP